MPLQWTAGDFVGYDLTSSDAFNVGELSFDVWRNGNAAATDFAIYYVVGGGTLTQAGSDFNIASSGVDGSGDPNQLATLTADGLNIAVDANETFEVRLYGWNATVAGNHHITGTSIVIPEPASLALLGLGGLAMLPRRKRA